MDFGSDCQIVLDWLKAHPSKWIVFAANRVNETQTEFASVAWRRVISADNPADIPSGCALPEWLSLPHIGMTDLVESTLKQYSRCIVYLIRCICAHVSDGRPRNQIKSRVTPKTIFCLFGLGFPIVILKILHILEICSR